MQEAAAAETTTIVVVIYDKKVSQSQNMVNFCGGSKCVVFMAGYEYTSDDADLTQLHRTAVVPNPSNLLSPPFRTDANY
jgi:hypothetical protein